MFPNEARLRNCTYSATMTIDNIKYIVRSGALTETEYTFYNLPKINMENFPL